MPWRKGNRLRLVTEEEADDATRQIFGEIKRTLGLPVLQCFYPALAVYPAFLRLHWQAIKPVAGSAELFDAADRLRADAYTRAHNYFQVPDLSEHQRAQGETDLLAVTDFFHYMEPLLLLLFCYQMQALEETTGNAEAKPTLLESPRTRKAPSLCGVEELSAPTTLKKRFEDIRRTTAVPFVNPEYCAFACWPEFLQAYWDSLKKMMASPVYDECRYGMRSTAWTLATKLPGTFELTLDQLTEAGLSNEQVASIARILELFIANLSGQLLNIAVAKIALEGGNLAVPGSSRASRRKRKRPAA